MSKKRGVAPTLTVRKIGGVARRVTHGGSTPICTKCGTNEHVVRMWHGPIKMWVCNVHFKVGSTETKQQSLKDRVLHRAPENVEYKLSDVLPNRAARRRRK